jgi:hypothetical protein
MQKVMEEYEKHITEADSTRDKAETRRREALGVARGTLGAHRSARATPTPRLVAMIYFSAAASKYQTTHLFHTDDTAYK